MFEDRTYENIMAEMMAEMPDGVSTEEGSLIFNACAKQALQLEEAYLALMRVEDNMYTDTQDEEHLVLNGADKGMPIKEATEAVVKAVFSQEIAEGTRFTANGMIYTAEEQMERNAYRLRCGESGKAGNIASGELSPVDFVEGYRGGKITEVLILGQEREDIGEYRKKIKALADAKYFGGNRADYERFVEDIPGVGMCKVRRRTPEERYIYPYILDSEYGVPSETLIKEVQEAVDPETGHGEGDGIAPVGHFVEIKPAVSRTVSITAEITYDDGYSQESVQSYMDNAIDAYFLLLKKEWKKEDIMVRVSQIEARILAVDGIIDITDVKLNGAAGNIMLSYAEVPERGTVNGI